MNVARLEYKFRGHEYLTYIPVSDIFMDMVERTLAYRAMMNKCYFWWRKEYLEIYDETGEDMEMTSRKFWDKYGNDTEVMDVERMNRFLFAKEKRKETKTYEALKEEIEAIADYIVMRFGCADYTLTLCDDEETDALVTRNGIVVAVNFKDGERVTTSGKAKLCE